MDPGWAEWLRTLASTAFGALLGWWFGRAGARHAEQLRHENEEKQRERTALIAMGRQLEKPAREVRVHARLAAGEHGQEASEKILQQVNGWWPPLQADLEAIYDTWKHSWQFDIGIARVMAYMMSVSVGTRADPKDGVDQFVERLSKLASDTKELEEAVATAAKSYAKEIPVMSRWEHFIWRVRRLFKIP